jgi:hypothetical protein
LIRRGTVCAAADSNSGTDPECEGHGDQLRQKGVR